MAVLTSKKSSVTLEILHCIFSDCKHSFRLTLCWHTCVKVLSGNNRNVTVTNFLRPPLLRSKCWGCSGLSNWLYTSLWPSLPLLTVLKPPPARLLTPAQVFPIASHSLSPQHQHCFKAEDSRLLLDKPVFICTHKSARMQRLLARPPGTTYGFNISSSHWAKWKRSCEAWSGSGAGDGC